MAKKWATKSDEVLVDEVLTDSTPVTVLQPLQEPKLEEEYQSEPDLQEETQEEQTIESPPESHQPLDDDSEQILKGKRGPKRSKVQLRLDRVEMVRLIRRGMTYQMVSEHLGLTYQSIYQDMKVVYRETAKELQEDVLILRTQKLEELAEVKVQAWEQWEKSKLPHQKRTNETSTNRVGFTTKEIEVEEGRLGDPRYLNTIRECIEKECELLGVNPSKQLEITGGLINFDILAGGIPMPGQPQMNSVEDEIRRLLNETRALNGLPGPEGSIQNQHPQHPQSDTIYIEVEEKDHS